MRFLLQLLVLIAISSTSLLSNDTRPYQFRDVSIDNKIGTSVSKDIFLTDEFDKVVNLKDLINKKPTIINFVYLNCPLLCHLLLDGMIDVISNTIYKVPKDYQIISISIDPSETNENLKAFKTKYHEELNISSGWLFLKGSSYQIKKLTEQFGYNYKYIPRTKDYSHPSAIYFYNKKITNYIQGVTFDVKAFNYSLMSSKENKTIKEKLITYCYYFDPDTQTYSLLIFKILRLLCLITVLILSIVIIYLLRKERKLRRYE